MNTEQLFQHIEQGALLLTPNRRLSAHLTACYNDWQHELNKRVWPSPSILPLHSWLNTCWQQLEDTPKVSLPLLLNEHQALASWQAIIQQSSHNELLKLQATAQTAYDAWKILQQWQVRLDDSRLDYNDDSRAFLDWANVYEKTSHEQAFCDASQLASIIERHLSELTLPSTIILACFDELTPAIKQLLSQLSQRCRLEYYDTRQNSSHVSVIASQDNETEYQQMAQWAVQQLEKGKKRIACIVPDLNQQRPAIERVFNDITSRNHFNISAGLALARYPIVHTALAMLKLCAAKTIDLPQISALLRSPFFGDAENERAARALFDAKLHQHGELALSRQQLTRWSNKYAPRFSQRLTNSQQLEQVNKAKPSQWADYFSQYLARLGWPGERSLNSPEYQVVQRWLALLSEFASLDHVLNACNINKALSLLQQVANNTQYQTQSTSAPIQILGLLEAAGMHFDALWLMGLSDENWPAQAKPNPFIALPLQASLAMPHANAERELSFTQQLHDRFAQSADEVIFSYPTSDGDRELRASPLLAAYPQIDISELDLTFTKSTADQLYATRDLEFFNDDQAPTISSDEAIHGGSSILKYQASCPFRAFATIRLNATGIEQPHLGLNALQRGVILHRTLELIWQELNDQQTLCELSEDPLASLIEKTIDNTFTEFKKYYPNSLTPRFVPLEKQRLSYLLNAWLELEKQRPPFTVLAQEKKQTITLAGINFSLRADRIDQTNDGEKLVIDYKTGKTSINTWFGERLDEPQLPLYSLCDEEIAGLLFAQVRIDDMRFNGITAEESAIAAVNHVASVRHEEAASNWSEQIKQWHQQLEQLAHDFASGKAKVDPKQPQLSCAHCDLQSLCRIQQ